MGSIRDRRNNQMNSVQRFGLVGGAAALALAALAAPASAAGNRADLCPSSGLYCGSTTTSKWSATTVHVDWSVSDKVRNGKIAWARNAYYTLSGGHQWGSWLAAPADGNGAYSPNSGTRMQSSLRGVALQICEHYVVNNVDTFVNCGISDEIDNPFT
jgi:hypothetical protein